MKHDPTTPQHHPPDASASVEIKKLVGRKAATNYYHAVVGALTNYYGLGIARPTLLGRYAEKLGLSGPITAQEFAALLDNRKPDGSRLTLRNRENRIVGYDICFGVPKSVSIRALIDGDQQLIKIVQEVVREVMEHAESYADCAVRKGNDSGTRKTRPTGNLLYVLLPDLFARPVPGQTADPHLHCHVPVQNATWDGEVFRALEATRLHAHIQLLQAFFQTRLARRLEEVGREVIWQRAAWELAGVSRAEVLLFSGRANQVEDIASERKIRDAAEKAQIAARNREPKEPTMEWEQQVAEWRHKRDQFRTDSSPGKPVSSAITPPALSVDEALRQGREHLEQTHWSWSRDAWAAAAMYAGRGRFGPVEIEQGINALISQSGRDKDGIQARVVASNTIFTSRDVRDAIADCVLLAKDGLNTLKPIEPLIEDVEVRPEQQHVLGRIIGCKDLVCTLDVEHGRERTNLLRSICRNAFRGGHEIIAVGATPKSMIYLREDDYRAMTIDELRRLPKGNVPRLLLVDDADSLGAAHLRTVLKKAAEFDSRVVLAGNVTFKSAKNRGDPLQYFARRSGSQIISARRPHLNSRSHLASDYSPGEFETPPLISPSAPFPIVEKSVMPPPAVRRGFAAFVDDRRDRAAAVVDEVVRSAAMKRPSVAVACEQYVLQLNDSIRRKLFFNTSGPKPENLRWVDALVEVTDADLRTGDIIRLPRDAPMDHADVSLALQRTFQKTRLNIVVGDRLQFTADLISPGGIFMAGELATVSGFGPNDEICLGDGRVVPSEARHFRHGWAVPAVGPCPSRGSHVIIADLDPQPQSALARLCDWSAKFARRIIAFTGAVALAGHLGFPLRRRSNLELFDASNEQSLTPQGLPLQQKALVQSGTEPAWSPQAPSYKTSPMTKRAVAVPLPPVPAVALDPRALDATTKNKPLIQNIQSDPSPRRYEILRKGDSNAGIAGPYLLREMLEQIRVGSVSPMTHVRTADDEKWTAAIQFYEFMSGFAERSRAAAVKNNPDLEPPLG